MEPRHYGGVFVLQKTGQNPHKNVRILPQFSGCEVYFPLTRRKVAFASFYFHSKKWHVAYLYGLFAMRSAGRMVRRA